MRKLVFIVLLFLCSAPAMAQAVEGDWEYLQMTTDGKVKVFEGGGKPWLELKDGKWSLMLSGRLSGNGSYMRLGRQLTLKYDDGSLYGDFDSVITEPKMTLTGIKDTKGFDLQLQRLKK